MKLAMLSCFLALPLLCGCGLTSEERRDVALQVAAEVHADGTPLTPAEREVLIAKYGAEKKESKGLDFLSGLIPLALSLGMSLVKKAV